MNRSYSGRVVAALVVAVGLMVGLFAQAASAQVIDRGPAPHIQAGQPGQARPDGSASSYGGGTTQAAQGVSTTASCGYWQTWQNGALTSNYTHCGNSSIQIRVKFGTWWPDSADTWVGPGTTNLSDHWISWGKRPVTGAWCISRC